MFVLVHELLIFNVDTEQVRHVTHSMIPSCNTRLAYLVLLRRGMRLIEGCSEGLPGIYNVLHRTSRHRHPMTVTHLRQLKPPPETEQHASHADALSSIGYQSSRQPYTAAFCSCNVT